MKRLKIHLLVLLFIASNLHAQLKEFMVQSYYNGKDGAQWFTADNPQDYFTNLAKYNINSVNFDFWSLICSKSIRLYYTMAKTAGLNTIVSELWSRHDAEYVKPANPLALMDTLSDKNTYNINGYCITDEPANNNPYNDISYIPPYSELIRNFDSSLLRFANLNTSITDDTSYSEDYIQNYINLTKSNLLSFDSYPTSDPINNSIFFKILYTFGLKSTSNSIPFIYVLTPINSLEDYYHPNENLKNATSLFKIRYCIYSALTYGAKGISYWPGFDWGNKVALSFKFIYNGTDKEQLVSLHQNLINHKTDLLSLNFASVYHVSTISTIGGDDEQIHDFCRWQYFPIDRFAQQIFYNTSVPITNWCSSSVPNELVVSFMTNSSGKIYYWIFNKSITQPMKVDMKVFKQPYDVLNNQLITDYNIIPDLVGSSGLYTIVLQPGEAKLFTPNDSTTIMPDLTISNLSSPFGSNFYALELANNIQISNVTFDGSTKSFMGNHIRLSTGTQIKYGSRVRLKAYNDSNTKPQTSSTSSGAPRKKTTNEDINENNSTTEPKIYPNPTTNNFLVNTDIAENETVDIKVFDTMGKIIKAVQSVSYKTSISLEHQPAGIYFVRLNKADKVYSYKIIKL